MLNIIKENIRGLLTRSIAIFIILSFFTWEIINIVQHNQDLVTFKHAKNITIDDFLQAKSQAINSHESFNQNNFNNVEVNDIILNKLITNRILDSLAVIYDFEISEKIVIHFLKKLPLFKNNTGNFDLKIFQQSIKPLNENEYFNNLREQIIRNVILSIFQTNLYVSKNIAQYIMKYATNYRLVDIIQVDSKFQLNLNKVPQVNTEELEYFYSSNQELFTKPEIKSFSYIIFNKHKFSTQELEDHIDNKVNLEDLSKIYKLPLKNITHSKLLLKYSNKEILANILALKLGEVSYPLNLDNNEDVLVIRLDSKQEYQVENLNTIKPLVKNLWFENYIKNKNFNLIKSVFSEYKKVKIKELSNQGVKIYTNILCSRDLTNEQNLSKQFIKSIFETNMNTNTPIFENKNLFYFAHVKDVILNTSISKEKQQTYLEYISNNIKESIISELITHLYHKNKVKINKNFNL